MEYDESKKIEVEVSENRFVENRVSEHKRRASLKKWNIDAIDMIIAPVTVGVFVSLGILFANIFKVSAAGAAVSGAISLLASVL